VHGSKTASSYRDDAANSLNVSDVNGAPPKHSSDLRIVHSTVHDSFAPRSKPARTVPVMIATAASFGTPPKDIESAIVEVILVFHLIVRVPVAVAATFRLTCPMSNAQFEDFANFNVADAVPPVTPPRQPFSLAFLIEIVGLTRFVLPSLGSPGVSPAIPANDRHAHPLVASGDEAPIGDTETSIATATTASTTDNPAPRPPRIRGMVSWLAPTRQCRNPDRAATDHRPWGARHDR
jgi:hypothetical protein